MSLDTGSQGLQKSKHIPQNSPRIRIEAVQLLAPHPHQPVPGPAAVLDVLRGRLRMLLGALLPRNLPLVVFVAERVLPVIDLLLATHQHLNVLLVLDRAPAALAAAIARVGTLPPEPFPPVVILVRFGLFVLGQVAVFAVTVVFVPFVATAGQPPLERGLDHVAADQLFVLLHVGGICPGKRSEEKMLFFITYKFRRTRHSPRMSISICRLPLVLLLSSKDIWLSELVCITVLLDDF